MIKNVSLIAFLFLSTFSNVTVLKAETPETTGKVIYTQDFESYNGSQAADAYAFFNIGMVCDSKFKSVINTGENITGYSYKAGGDNYCYSNGLLCFRNNTIPFISEGEGYYTTSFDIRINNAKKVGFSYLEPDTDKYYGGIEYNLETGNKTSSTKYYSVEYHESLDYYTFTFDLAYKAGDVWGTFYADFDGEGYIVVDNYKVSVSTNKYDEKEYEKVVKYSKDWNNSTGTTPSTLWAEDPLFWYNDNVLATTYTKDDKKGLLLTASSTLQYYVFGGIGSGSTTNLANLENGKKYTVKMYVEIISNETNAKFHVEPQFTQWTGVYISKDGSVNIHNTATTSKASYENNILTFDFVATCAGSNAYIKITGENLKKDDSIFIDDFEIYEQIEKEIEEPEEPTYKYIQEFETYDGHTAVDSFLWNNLNWCSDAESKTFVSNEEAITGSSLKVSSSVAGYFDQNYVLCSRSYANPFDTGEGKWTIEFDVRLNNIVELSYRLKQNDTNGIISKITFNPEYPSVADSSSPFYSITESNGILHVSVDAVTEDSNNWSEFAITYGEGGGYMVIDNISIKESTNDYNSNFVIYKDTYEGYDNQNVGDYLWNKTHFYSDAGNKLTIEEGFDGKAITFKADKGQYQAGNYIGLQGSNGPGATILTKDSIYELAFDIALTNVTSYSMYINYLNPDKGDIEFFNITIDPIKKIYTCGVAAEVTYLADHIHVSTQFKAPMSALIFGYFALSCNDNAIAYFDNYQLSQLNDFTIALFKSGFENGEVSPFVIETNLYKEEKILGKITTDEDLVINGTYSALCGFDATNITIDSDEWGALLKAPNEFDEGHSYTVQFRFNIISPSKHFFYLELGGPTGMYIRFSQTGIIEASTGVEGNVIEDDNCYILQAKFDVTKDLTNLLIATYGGGFIVIDDISIYQGVVYPELDAIAKYSPTGEKYISENFENQNSGDYFVFKNFVSGVDVFGVDLGYNDNAINGYVSPSIYSGSAWAEQIYTKAGVLEGNTKYTVTFRYKPLDNSVGNINVIVRGDTEKYIAFTLDGKATAFTTSGGGFYKGIDIAYVKDCNGYYEATVSFISPAGTPKFIIGTYGVCRFAIDDITIYKGEIASFDSNEVSVIETANRDTINAIINNAKLLSSDKYSTDSYEVLINAINDANVVVANLLASQEEIDAEIVKINNAKNNLVLKTVDDFNKLVEAIDFNKDRKTLYEDLAKAIEAYKLVDDKTLVETKYATLVNYVNAYNDYSTNANKTIDYKKVLEALALASGISLLFMQLRKRGNIL